MKNSLEKKIIIFALLLLLLTIAATTGMHIVGFRKDYVTALVLRSQTLGGALKGNLEKIANLGIDITTIPGLGDKCREIVTGNREIAYCLITDMENGVIFTNDQQFSRLHFDEMRRWRFSTGDHRIAHLDNEQYIDTVSSIRTPEGRPVALVHVGFPVRIITDKVRMMVLHSLAILVISLLAAFSLVLLFVKRRIMKPMSALLGGVKQISEGAFDTRIEQLPDYEFNELAKNINFMSESLKFREEEIQKSYDDLEQAHQELHNSFQRLEQLRTKLERSEQLYKSLMEDSSDAIVVVGDDETVRMVNKEAEEFFGYSAQEMVGLPLTKLLLLLNIENIPRVHRLFREAFGGSHCADEMPFTNKGGGHLLSRLNLSCIQSGDERMIQAIFNDITREREIIDNLSKSAADLARLNRMKDSFLGLASHELKTPLTVIMGYAELITTDLADQLDPTVAEMIQNIANAAARLDNIVKDMVDVSLIDEKRLQLRLEELDVNRLVELAINELRFFFSMRHQELRLNLDTSIPGIRGDSLRLMQLLSNVLGNAIKFTPDGGTITVTTSAKYLLRGVSAADELPEASPEQLGREHHLYVEIAVADTGIGIDREDQGRIFEKFFETGSIAEHSTGKVAFKAKGTGLGLTIAKGIVEMHGGEIWVESPGYDPVNLPGTVFHILLPVTQTAGDSAVNYMRFLQ